MIYDIIITLAIDGIGHNSWYIFHYTHFSITLIMFSGRLGFQSLLIDISFPLSLLHDGQLLIRHWPAYWHYVINSHYYWPGLLITHTFSFIIIDIIEYLSLILFH